nr:hypothetical protein Iba_chr04aCG10090 [Ipomoea batatas]
MVDSKICCLDFHMQNLLCLQTAYLVFHSAHHENADKGRYLRRGGTRIVEATRRVGSESGRGIGLVIRDWRLSPKSWLIHPSVPSLSHCGPNQENSFLVTEMLQNRLAYKEMGETAAWLFFLLLGFAFSLLWSSFSSSTISLLTRKPKDFFFYYQRL